MRSIVSYKPHPIGFGYFDFVPGRYEQNPVQSIGACAALALAATLVFAAFALLYPA
jgi:hypothetical protein